MTSSPSLAAPQLRSADPPGRGYTCVGNRLLEEWVQAQDVGISIASAKVGEACGVSRQYVTGWRGGRAVPPKHRVAIASVTGIPLEAWESWEQLGPIVPDEPPASEERAAAQSDDPLASTAEELRRVAARLKRQAKDPNLTHTQRTQADGKLVTALSRLAALEERAAIVDHPDFAPLVEDLVRAVQHALGPDAPEGIESVIADELERLQAARAATADRRAA